jgi:deazaflavin-dependent oxidoreductase (nitroreductase family)
MAGDRTAGSADGAGTVRPMADFNQQIIDEFRANDGVVGGPFEGAPMLLLHSTGAKSGAERVNPMVYQALGDRFAVFASKAGADTNPDWYHNLKANPQASIEIGADTVKVTAAEATGAERDEIWEAQKKAMPGFAEYEAKTSRVIPVMILTPAT